MNERTGFIVGLVIALLLTLMLVGTAVKVVSSIAEVAESPRPAIRFEPFGHGDQFMERLDSLMVAMESDAQQIDSLSITE